MIRGNAHGVLHFFKEEVSLHDIVGFKSTQTISLFILIND